MGNKQLLVVSHAPSANTQVLLEALLRGARHEDVDGVDARHVAPLEATVDDVMGADAVILGTTENFGYMSGALKDFFDRIYYPCIDRTDAKPYALYIRAGQDGTGAQRAVEAIASGLRWKPVLPPLVMQGKYRDEFPGMCEELGMYVAAALGSGLY